MPDLPGDRVASPPQDGPRRVPEMPFGEGPEGARRQSPGRGTPVLSSLRSHLVPDGGFILTGGCCTFFAGPYLRVVTDR